MHSRRILAVTVWTGRRVGVKRCEVALLVLFATGAFAVAVVPVFATQTAPCILVSAQVLESTENQYATLVGALNPLVDGAVEILNGDSLMLTGSTRYHLGGGCNDGFNLKFDVTLAVSLCPIQLPNGAARGVVVIDVSSAEESWYEERECAHPHVTGGHRVLPLQFTAVLGGFLLGTRYSTIDFSTKAWYEVTDWDGWFLFPDKSGSLCTSTTDGPERDVKGRRAILFVDPELHAHGSVLGAFTFRWSNSHGDTFAYRITLTYSRQDGD